MLDRVLLYAGAFLPFAWGIAHLFPTRSVVKEFGDISQDNRRIIAMEWITEGVALISLGLLVGLVTFLDHHATVSVAVYWLVSAALVALAIVSLRTGAKTNFLPFRLCPVIFLSSCVLILIGAHL